MIVSHLHLPKLESVLLFPESIKLYLICIAVFLLRFPFNCYIYSIGLSALYLPWVISLVSTRKVNVIDLLSLPMILFSLYFVDIKWAFLANHNDEQSIFEELSQLTCLIWRLSLLHNYSCSLFWVLQNQASFSRTLTNSSPSYSSSSYFDAD